MSACSCPQMPVMLSFTYRRKSVATWSLRGVHPLAHHADAPHEFFLDEGMDVLRAFEGELPALDVGEDLLQGVADLFDVACGQDLGLAQHLDVRDARKDVVPVQLFVKGQRLIECVRALRARLGKAPFPQFHNFLLRI